MQHEYIFRIFGKESHKQITANLDLLLRRFNEVKNFFTLFVRYYECISLLHCILIGSKVKSSLSVIMISSFRSSFGSKHRFSSLNISTSGFICWKSSSSWPHSKWFLKKFSIECRRSSEIALIFTLIHLVISRELAFSPNQSDARLKSTATWSPEFSRASGRSF